MFSSASLFGNTILEKLIFSWWLPLLLFTEIWVEHPSVTWDMDLTWRGSSNFMGQETVEYAFTSVYADIVRRAALEQMHICFHT